MHGDVDAPVYDMRRARRPPDPGGCPLWNLQGFHPISTTPVPPIEMLDPT
jgi:hypothetical protein